MEIVGIVILGIIAFILLGIGGWILKLLGYILEFLFDGFLNSIGCLFWVIVIILIIVNL